MGHLRDVMRVSTVSVLGLMALLFACAAGSGQGGADGGDDEGSSSGESATTAKSCAEEEVSVGQSTEKEEDCATIAIPLNMQTNAALAGITRTVGESIATTLDSVLKRANVITSSDGAALVTYTAMVQMLGGEDDNGEAALRIAGQYSNADILVVPSIAGDPNGTLIVSIAADDRSGVRIGGVTFSGTATQLGNSLDSLGKSLAEKIKKARVCLSLTPVRAVVNFENETQRRQEFTASVKDLKNEPMNEDKVGFELEKADSGTLSSTSVAISDGEARTTFTMTKKQANALTVTYKGRFATQTDQSTIIPLCGWILVIEGDKVFNLNRDSPPAFHALFGEGSWITINGTDPVSGHVALSTLEDDNTIYGTGWMIEKMNTSSAAFWYLYSVDGEGRIVGECGGQATQDGTAKGEWMVWGTQSGDTITIQGLAMGLATGGETGSGKCSLAGLFSGGGGTHDVGTLSEFHDVTMPLKTGATAEATGQGAFFMEKYKYTLTLKRAAP